MTGAKGETSEKQEGIFTWPNKVLTVTDLERHWRGQSNLVASFDLIVTPLAWDFIKQRRISLQQSRRPEGPEIGIWGCGQDEDYAVVATALSVLRREQIEFRDFCRKDSEMTIWCKEVSVWVTTGHCQGMVVFSRQPGLICCLANKIPGVRAVPVSTMRQAANATMEVGANLLAIEMPGRTFFEIRQILRLVVEIGTPSCPTPLAKTLTELDGYAHC